MKIRRLDHVSINVLDLPAAIAFFLDLGLEMMGEAEMEGALLDAVVGMQGVKTSIAMLLTPGGGGNLELVKYHAPPAVGDTAPSPPHALGIRHIAFAVEDIDAIVAKLKKKGVELFSEIQTYQDSYKLLYVRGPEGIILELAEELG